MADQTQFHLRKKPQHVDIADTGGSAAAPAIVLASDPDTGIFFATGAVGFSVDGTEVARIDVDGLSQAAIRDGSIEPSKIVDTFTGLEDGLGVLRVARATFDPSANTGERTVAAHGLGVTIPDNAIIVGGFVQVNTTFQSTAGGTDKATIALHAQSADDLVAAVAIETGTPWDAGLHALIPKANTPESTGIALTEARELTATVAVAALTAGKLTLFVYYVQGA